MQKSKIKKQSIRQAQDIKSQIEETKTNSSVEVTSAKKSTKTLAEPTTMEELLAQTGYALKGWKRGEVVTGTLLTISPKHMSLNIGGKSEAVIHEKEMPYITYLVRGLKVGDTVSVHVVNPENDRGQTVVSLRRTAMQKRWDTLTDLMKKSEAVEVSIRELAKGGFLVDYLGLRGFIPLSQADS